MRGLHSHLVSKLLPLISAIVVDQTTDLIVGHGLLTLWQHTLSFGRWLRLSNSDILYFVLLCLSQILKDPPNSWFGQRLASKMLVSSALRKDGLWDDISVTTLAILLQELHYRSDHDCLVHLDVIIAVYVAFSRTVAPNGKHCITSVWLSYRIILGRIRMDDHMAKACKLLSASYFSHILELTSASLSDTGHSPRDLTSLAHLSTILLHDHPDSMHAS
jgi:hypothetical protein